MSDLNHALFLALNASSSNASGLVPLLAIVLAKYVIVLVPLHLVLVWIGGDRGMRFVALTAFAGLVLAILVNSLIGAMIYSPRPFVIGLGHTLIDHRDNSSMPSNHGTVFFTYAAVLMIFGRRPLGLIFAGIGLMVAWSRIYLGIHYPLDMLVAAIVSVVSAYAAVRAMMVYGAGLLERAETIYGFILSRLHLSRPSAR